MLNIPEEIKDILHLDSWQKNIRIHFPNGERTDICNDMIVRDSVKLTESLCSQKELKFGLCESPVFECSVVGCENVKGASIEVFCEIYCNASVEGAVFRTDLGAYVYPIPYGIFTVDECKRDSDMQYRQIRAIALGIPDELPQWEIQKRSFLTNQAAAYTVDLFKTAIPSAITKLQSGWEQMTGTQRSLYSVNVSCTDRTFYDRFDIALIGRAFSIPWSLYENLFFAEYPVDGRDLRLSMEDSRNKILNFIEPYVSSVNYEDIKNTLEKFLNTVGYGVEFEYRPSASGTTYTQRFWTRDKCFYPNLGLPDIASGINVVTIYIVTDVRFGYYDSDIYGDHHWVIPPDGGYGHDRNLFNIYRINNIELPERMIGLPKEAVNSLYRVKDAQTSPRELISAAVEIMGLFFTIGRNNAPQLRNIKQQFVKNPEQNLYPGASNYPEGAHGGKIFPSEYQKCWYDDEYVKPYGLITCLYTKSNQEKVMYEHYCEGYDVDSNNTEYRIYDISENYIIANSTWTQAEIEQICQAIENNISGVTYLPVEFTGRGLPYVEPGDTFEILTRSNDSITTIVLNRTISGEQVLTDNYKSV